MPKRAVLGAMAIAMAGLVAWSLFGWKTVRLESLGTVTIERWFGRNLTMSLDTGDDGIVDDITEFPWDHPYDRSLDGPCDYPGSHSREDRDRDGRWDTWTADRCGDPGVERWLVEADTTGDGAPDLRIATDDSYSVWLQLEQARGF